MCVDIGYILSFGFSWTEEDGRYSSGRLSVSRLCC